MEVASSVVRSMLEPAAESVVVEPVDGRLVQELVEELFQSAEVLELVEATVDSAEPFAWYQE